MGPCYSRRGVTTAGIPAASERRCYEKRAHHRERVTSPREPGSASAVTRYLVAQVALVNVVFARGQRCRATLVSSVKNWTFLPACHWRRRRWFRRVPVRLSRHKTWYRRGGIAALTGTEKKRRGIDAIGDARFHPSAENGRLVFWHSLPVPLFPRALPAWTIPILILRPPSFIPAEP